MMVTDAKRGYAKSSDPTTPVAYAQNFDIPNSHPISSAPSVRARLPASLPFEQTQSSGGGLVRNNWAAIMTRKSSSVNSSPLLQSPPTSAAGEDNARRRRARSMTHTSTLSLEVTSYRGITATPGQNRSFSLTSKPNTPLHNSQDARQDIKSHKRYRRHSVAVVHSLPSSWVDSPIKPFTGTTPSLNGNLPHSCIGNVDSEIRHLNGHIHSSSTPTPARRFNDTRDRKQKVHGAGTGNSLSIDIGNLIPPGRHFEGRGMTDHIHNVHALHSGAPANKHCFSFKQPNSAMASLECSFIDGRTCTDMNSRNSMMGHLGRSPAAFQYKPVECMYRQGANSADALQSQSNMFDGGRHETKNRIRRRMGYSKLTGVPAKGVSAESMYNLENKAENIFVADDCGGNSPDIGYPMMHDNIDGKTDGSNNVSGNATNADELPGQKPCKNPYLTTIQASTRPYTPDNFLLPDAGAATCRNRNNSNSKRREKRRWSFAGHIQDPIICVEQNNDSSSSSAESVAESFPETPSKLIQRLRYRKARGKERSELVKNLAGVDPVEGVPTFPEPIRTSGMESKSLHTHNTITNTDAAATLVTSKSSTGALNSTHQFGVGRTASNFGSRVQEGLTRLRKIVSGGTHGVTDNMRLPGRGSEITYRRIDFKWHGFLSKKGYGIAPVSDDPPPAPPAVYVMPSGQLANNMRDSFEGISIYKVGSTVRNPPWPVAASDIEQTSLSFQGIRKLSLKLKNVVVGSGRK